MNIESLYNQKNLNPSNHIHKTKINSSHSFKKLIKIYNLCIIKQFGHPTAKLLQKKTSTRNQLTLEGELSL